jgi:hypothetical protein
MIKLVARTENNGAVFHLSSSQLRDLCLYGRVVLSCSLSNLELFHIDVDAFIVGKLPNGYSSMLVEGCDCLTSRISLISIKVGMLRKA